MKKMISNKVCFTDMILWIIDLGMFEIGVHVSNEFVHVFFIILGSILLPYIMWRNYIWFYKERIHLKDKTRMYVIGRSTLLAVIACLLNLRTKNDLERSYVIILMGSLLIIFILLTQSIVLRTYFTVNEVKTVFPFNAKATDYQKIMFIRNKIYQQTGLNLANGHFSLDNFDYFKRLACRVSKNISKLDLEEYKLLLTMNDKSFNWWDWNKLFGNIIENGITGIISMAFFGSLAIQVANVSLPSVSVNNSFNLWIILIVYIALILFIVFFPVLRVHFKHKKIAKQKSFFIALFELALTYKE